MNNKNLKTMLILKTAISIAGLVVGIYMLFYNHRMSFSLNGDGYITFGADFYTETYELLYDINSKLFYFRKYMLDALVTVIRISGAVVSCVFAYLSTQNIFLLIPLLSKDKNKMETDIIKAE